MPNTINVTSHNPSMNMVVKRRIHSPTPFQTLSNITYVCALLIYMRQSEPDETLNKLDTSFFL